jgi:hypothetical protein
MCAAQVFSVTTTTVACVRLSRQSESAFQKSRAFFSLTNGTTRHSSALQDSTIRAVNIGFLRSARGIIGNIHHRCNGESMTADFIGFLRS